MKKEPQKKKIENAIVRSTKDGDALKWLRQPNNLTYLRGDMTKPQLNIFNELLDALQERISERLKGGRTTIFDDSDFVEDSESGIKSFPISIKMSEIAPASKYKDVEAMAVRLASMTFGVEGSYEGTHGVFYTPIFDRVFVPAGDRNYKGKSRRDNKLIFFIKQQYSDEIWKISSYTRYLKEVVKECDSQYSIRIYLFLAAQKRRGQDVTEWKVEYPVLHSMFGFSTYKPATKDAPAVWEKNRYQQYKDFKRRVMKVSYDELNAMDGTRNIDISFEYEEIYPSGKKGGEPEYIHFTISKTELGRQEDSTSQYATECIKARKDMMYSFNLTKSQCDQVMYLVTEPVLPLLQDKIRELAKYMETHHEIDDPQLYALKSLKSAMLDAQPLQEVEEVREDAATPAPVPSDSSEGCTEPSIPSETLASFRSMLQEISSSVTDSKVKDYLLRITPHSYAPDTNTIFIAVSSNTEAKYIDETFIVPNSALVRKHFGGVGYIAGKVNG